jgi:hypothetical protein
LNPHAFRRHPLKMVCLPIPPLPHGATSYAEAVRIITKRKQAKRMQNEEVRMQNNPDNGSICISTLTSAF